MPGSILDQTFAHGWTAEVLLRRPLILPRRQFVYPASADEVERGALEMLVQAPGGEPFLATCALGFRDPAVPTGVWAMPDPEWLCAVSGGYAYLINVGAPERFVFLRYRPVLQVRAVWLEDEDTAARRGLLMFLGHHSIVAWGSEGEAWESDRLSSEGVTLDRIEGNRLYGRGWDLRTDRDVPFGLDLNTGSRLADAVS